MNKFLIKLKMLLRTYPLIMNFLRILRDSRYLYHFVQGKFILVRTRKNLMQFEKMFFKKRIKLKDYFENHILDKKELLSFRDNGILINPIDIDPSAIENIKSKLENYLCHDPEKSELGYFHIKDKPRGVKRAYYQCEDLVRVPDIMKIANDPHILAYVSSYMGVLPSIDSIYAWWSFPSDGRAATQSYHRDVDTLHALKFMTYLTDVDSTAGPTICIRGSMKRDFNTAKDQAHTDQEIEEAFGIESRCEIVGKIGSNMLGDMFAFHKGLAPVSKPRLLLQVYYSLRQTPFGPKDQFIDAEDVKYLRSNKATRLINKNIVKYPRFYF